MGNMYVSFLIEGLGSPDLGPRGSLINLGLSKLFLLVFVFLGLFILSRNLESSHHDLIPLLSLSRVLGVLLMPLGGEILDENAARSGPIFRFEMMLFIS